MLVNNANGEHLASKYINYENNEMLIWTQEILCQSTGTVVDSAPISDYSMFF